MGVVTSLGGPCHVHNEQQSSDGPHHRAATQRALGASIHRWRMHARANVAHVRRLAESRDGLVSRREALAAGVSLGVIRSLVESGALVTLRPGIYVLAEDWFEADHLRQRPLLLVRAAHRSLASPHVVSHTSAALAQDLPFLRSRTRLIHVTKPHGPRARVRAGIKHHQARYCPEQVRCVDGLPVLDLARTALDIAREDGFAPGVVAIDAARQRGVTTAALSETLAAMWKWPGSTTARAAFDFSDPGAESVGESLTRILLAELDLGLPIHTQFELRDSSGRVRCDLQVGRHVFEFEGKIKLLAPEQGGVADRPAVEILAARQARHDWVCGFELGMSHVTWDDLWGARREATKRRLRREYAATVARFGTSIDDLAPYIVHRRPP